MSSEDGMSPVLPVFVNQRDIVLGEQSDVYGRRRVGGLSGHRRVSADRLFVESLFEIWWSENQNII